MQTGSNNFSSHICFTSNIVFPPAPSVFINPCSTVVYSGVAGVSANSWFVSRGGCQWDGRPENTKF